MVDAKPQFARQAALWALSLLVHGEQEAESLVVHTVGEGDPRLNALLDAWGVERVPVEPFDTRHPYSNKLVQFATPALQRAAHVVLCDCDLAFAAPIDAWTRGHRIRARIAERPWLLLDQWRSIFAAANLRFPRDTVLAGNGERTLPGFCNGGLYVVPHSLFSELGGLWCRWDRWLLDRPDLLEGPKTIFIDQISFALAVEELGQRIDYLPVELNYHSGKRPAAALQQDRREGFVPRVLHYHHAVGPRGFLFQERVPSMNAATERVNQLIRSLNELLPVPPSPAERDAEDMGVADTDDRDDHAQGTDAGEGTAADDLTDADLHEPVGASAVDG